MPKKSGAKKPEGDHAKRGPKKLIVVESPNKIKSIEKYAGPGYVVKASFGHITELGGKGIGLGVDMRNNYQPSFQLIEEKKPVVAELKMAAKDCDEILIATDADREGEAIGWHVSRYLQESGKPIRRMTFTEITQKAIQEALKPESLREINQALVDAQIVRQILDKLIGFKVSPLLWTNLRDGLSAGRVQSVALRLIVEREREIRAFVPQEFWYIDAHLQKKTGEAFTARLVTPDKDFRLWEGEKEVKKILESLEGATYKVASVEQKSVVRSPNPPFTTSTLQQAAGSQFGWTPKRTMEVAQRLYEGYGSGGFITYHRTDSFHISQEAAALAQIYIKSNYGPQYLPPQIPDYSKKEAKKRSKKGDGEKGGVRFESHEAIRPTNLQMDPSSLQEPDHRKLYELIWRRFLSSQMSEAKYDTVSVDISANKSLFRAKGSTIAFDGWLKVWTYSKSEETQLPPLKAGEPLLLVRLDPTKHETKPPDRFTPSSIVKILEDKGIGRPSTYASIIDTIQKRKYVDLKGKSLVPTGLGIQVCDHLLDCKFDFMDPKFTSLVEGALDDVAGGELKPTDVVDLFWTQLRENIKYANQLQEAREKTDFKCPQCQRPLLLKTSRRGTKFFGCSGYSDNQNKCEVIMGVGEDGKPKEIVIEKVGRKCGKCGGNIVKREGKFGVFYGCDNYPACKAIYDENGKIKTKPKPKPSGVRCQKCGGEMIIRKNRKTGNEFLACSGYPKCKNAQPLKWGKTGERKEFNDSDSETPTSSQSE